MALCILNARGIACSGTLNDMNFTRDLETNMSDDSCHEQHACMCDLPCICAMLQRVCVCV